MRKKTGPQARRSTTTTRTAVVPAANEDAIKLLQQWATEPQPYTAAFWKDFDREMRENRFNLRRPT
jgi:hypothetical protein